MTRLTKLTELFYFKGNLDKYHILLSELNNELIDNDIKVIVSILK